MTKQGKKPRKLDFVGKEAPADRVVGWRAWKVKRIGDKVVLRSPLQDAEWKPDKPMTGAVDPKKSGGIYCFKSIAKLKQYTTIKQDGKDIVIGQVVLWGDIAEHKDGYRGENGYPVRVWTNDISLQSLIRDTYKTSVQIGFARSLPTT